MNAWTVWAGWSLVYCGLGIALLCIECYASEHVAPGADRLATATVFHEGWLFASVMVTSGLNLVFQTSAGDVLAMLAAAWLLMTLVKRLLRPKA